MKEKGYQFGDDTVIDCGFTQAEIVILPICYENRPSYGAGCAEGPLHLLEASTQLETIDEETGQDWTDLRIHTRNPLKPDANPEIAVAQMKEAAHSVLSRKKALITLGGDHAVAIGPINAAAGIYQDLGVLQVDAHLDLRDAWNGSHYNHACVMRRVIGDMQLPAAQVGIRSFSKEEAVFVKNHGLKPIYAHTIDPLNPGWIDRALNQLPEIIYLTIDLDGLDPSVIPGTGTPEPGGLSYRQLLALIKTLGARKKVIAADICELAKIPHMQVSEFTAAKIATKLMLHCFGRPGRM